MILPIMNKSRAQTQVVKDVLLSDDELVNHAMEVAANHITLKDKKSTGILLRRLDESFNSITATYINFNDRLKNNDNLCPASDWLLDNYYLLEEQVKEVKQNLGKERFLKLKVLKSEPLKGYPRIYAIALEILSHTDGKLSEKNLEDFINAYQTKNVLSIDEVWSLSLMVRIALIEYISILCSKMEETQSQRDKVKELDYTNHKSLLYLIEEDLRIHRVTPDYIEHLLKMLRRKRVDQGEIVEYIENKLTEYNTSIDSLIQQSHSQQASKKISMVNAIISLKTISTLDWNEIFERLSVVEEILNQDPSGTYPKMDFQSRDFYRHQIEKIAVSCDVSEARVARKAKDFAQEVAEIEENSKSTHVGYYIIGDGRKRLMGYLGYRGNKVGLHNVSLSKYLLPVILLTSIITCALVSYAYITSHSIILSIVAGLVAFIPASEIAIGIINWSITHAYPIAYFPKLEYREGLTEEVCTLVVIPSLFTCEESVKRLIKNLEVYYLANKEDNLFFSIAGDFKDSNQEKMPTDDSIIATAIDGIRELNKKYSQEQDIFYYFHRHRLYSKKQNNWMGWERKRGSLVELNSLLMGNKSTSYSIIEGDITILQSKVKYVITIDSDTNLPINAAKKLIGTISHPLNKAVYDKEKRIVTEGYGLIQPRITIDMESSNKSIFTRIFAGPGGIDSYSSAFSDVYQDLFGEGIFTGKGIYDLNIFNNTLRDEIPEDTVLSHDLLEGSYVRTGLVTDIELIDSYPSKYSSYIMRLHRWVRGDWQLIKWLFSDKLSSLSKWKILDNLRRSLVSIEVVLLIVLGLTIFPGNPLFWLGFSLITILYPLLISFFDYIINKYYRAARDKLHGNLICGFNRTVYYTLLKFLFLPYEAYMVIDAILRTLYRVFISKRNLIEWTTAADIERKLKDSPGAYFFRMRASIFISVVTIILISLINQENLLYILPVSLLWILSPYIAYRISLPQDEKLEELGEEDKGTLKRIARKTWAYYEDFAGEDNNYLPPDNYQEDPPNGVAHRTSPTNIGFLLSSILVARDFGYISTLNMIDRMGKTIYTIEKLESWKGHLYNWYDTRTLEPLRPFFISTVDSGNLVSYLITAKEGVKEYLDRSIIDIGLIKGLKDTSNLVQIEINESMKEKRNDNGIDMQRIIDILNGLLQSDSLSLPQWYNSVKEIELRIEGERIQEGYWFKKFRNTLRLCIEEVQLIYPYENISSYLRIIMDLPTKDSHDEEIKKYINQVENGCSLVQLRNIYENIIAKLDKKLKNDQNESIEQKLLTIKEEITRAMEFTRRKVRKAQNLIARIEKIINETKFAPLYDYRRHLFAIGYNLEDQSLTNSYYDLLASEERTTSYLAIARGEVPYRHWFKMGRALSIVQGYRGLVSWTGTIFEYLMPNLLMENYKNTLFDETYRTVVKVQKSYGVKREVPWGTSESGYYAVDANLNYQYKAFGVPSLGLKRGLIEEMVISPYSTLLALPLSPKDAFENLERLIEDGIEGTYGFYEAIDYTPKRIPLGEEKGIVKNYMAHHLGMSFAALNNFFHDNAMKRRFHSDPVVKVGEILLKERIPLRVIVTKEIKEPVEPFAEDSRDEKLISRVYGMPEGPLPKCHLLSNGKYSVVITNGGRGYSQIQDLQVTRWRRRILNNTYGTFVFLKEINNNKIWSATYDPFKEELDGYSAIFSQDKAEFLKSYDNIYTHTEVLVSSEDDVEIRKVTITNHRNAPVNIEITSYLEPVMASQGADVSHPAFSKLFVRTDVLEEYNSLIASRRPREESEKPIWTVHTMFVKGEVIGGIQYETNRENFIGRGNNLTNARAFKESLSNTTGIVIDPIMSLRRIVRIPPSGKIEVCYTTGVCDNKEEALKLIKKYNTMEPISRAMKLAYTRSQVEASYLGLTGKEIEDYEELLAHVIFVSPSRRKYEHAIRENRKGQPALWTHGISGDNPMVMVTINKEEDIEIILQVLKAHEYWRMRGLRVDFIIINEDKSDYIQPLQDLIRDTVFESRSRGMENVSGGIFIKKSNVMTEEDLNLLYTDASIVLKAENGDIKHQMMDYDKDVSNVDGDLPGFKRFDRGNVIYIDKEVETPNLLYYNGYGGFSQDGREYIIRLRHKEHTPAPWTNVVANKNFGFIVTESGGGYTWAENSRENKITPWSNDPVSDTPGEIIYLRDENSGDIWTITPLPIREKESYVVKHGHGYSSFSHNSHGISQEQNMFISTEDSVKLYYIKLKNNSSDKRTITLTHYIMPVLGVNDEQSQQYITSEIDESTGALLIRNSFNSDFPERIVFMDCTEVARCYTGDNREFMGDRGDLKSPEGLKREGLSNRVGAGYDPCGATQVTIDIEANEEKKVAFILGNAKSMDEVTVLVNKYRNMTIVEHTLDKSIDYWKEHLKIVEVDTPDESMNIMINHWLPYQTIACRILAKSAFYQSGGAYGYRDQLQDAMNSVTVYPDNTRNQILLNCAHQFVEGDVQHWWHPTGSDGADKGIRTKFSDDLLWLPLATTEYVNQTGDYELLDEVVGYIESEPLKDEDVDERYEVPRLSQEKSSVFEHCIRAIERGLKFGDHGIPLMGSGDWNDGMNQVGNKGKGESIWLGWFLCKILRDFAPICKKRGDYDRAARYLANADSIAKAIEAEAWDGKWYRRAYFDDGTPLGSSQNTECIIDSLAQTWSIISGYGDKDRAKVAMDSVESYLVKEGEGLILLFTPPFDKSDLDPGYIKGYVPGVRENGGQYTHAAVWVINAYALMGQGDKAWKLYNLINPINHSRTSIEGNIYKVEPYVMAADVYAASPHIGRGGWTWYTGAAGWMYRVGIENILGLRLEGDKLKIDPCIPRDWKEYTIKYRYMDSDYVIEIKNPYGVNKGLKEMHVDGDKIEGNRVKLKSDKQQHKIEVVLGE